MEERGMAVNEPKIRKYLKSFDLVHLFKEELGWDTLGTTYSIPVDGSVFALEPLAQKRGMVALLCQPLANGTVPEYAVRRRIERELTKSAREHIVIYVDAAKTTQIWQWAKREKGRPTACREHTWRTTQSGDALVQKLRNIAFTLDEEEELSLVLVTGRAKAAFDIERVTKRFYDQFKTEQTKFLGFIKGIEDQGDREWYASVMLNRLMFVYFIQKKNFLDNDPNYLRNRLARVQGSQGKGRFHSFYRYFLLRLFHEGLGERERSAELDALLGKVPYLNGGIFAPHQLEQDEKNEIDIVDEAFERVFDFFDRYQWHLDERPLRNDNEINPDVLGFIFEKFINQKQMGAYYTKEDITEYIGRNTIVPYLFDAAKKECRIAFEPQGSVWRQPKEHPERYIFDAVAKGCDLALPTDIEAGIADVSKRGNWNQPASAEYALPTEIWRETVARRQRYADVRAKLAAGEVTVINDFITYNLDIRQLAEDTITGSEGPELLRAFWKALTSVRILDPTVGSGAFLFAALNILEPLYEACLNRMEAFVADSEREEPTAPVGAKSYADFRAILKRVSDHRDRRYHIYKSIIINNLYGVDIMEEATEICKLRLFLKLVSVVERVDDVEPLPDIDFNIRAGNTLVGYASREELRKAVQGDDQGKLGFDDDVFQTIEHKATLIDQQFNQFREAQTNQSEIATGDLGHQRKKAIQSSLDELRNELDAYLAKQYGVSGKKPLANWKESHKPFHWFVEFFGVLKDGGFDVIIGNPPWKEYAATKKDYTVRNYATERCGNLYGMATERAQALVSSAGTISFIVQLPLATSSRMSSVRHELVASGGNLFVATFDDRPGKLFEGLQHCRSSVFVLNRNGAVGTTAQLAVTRYQRWQSSVRGLLFASIHFDVIPTRSEPSSPFEKTDGQMHLEVLGKIIGHSSCNLALHLVSKSPSEFIFYQEATQYWVKATSHAPFYARNSIQGVQPHGRYLYFQNSDEKAAACAVLNSSLFYLYFITYSDCFHLSDTVVSAFPVPRSALTDSRLIRLNAELMSDLDRQSETKTITTKDGDSISYAEYVAAKSKPIIDEIDRVLAKHYGFTDEETDFIINYDIKYRMGRGGDEAEEE